MPSVDERLAYLEGRTEEHTTALHEIRDEVRGFRDDMNARLTGIDQRFVAIDQRFIGLDQCFVGIDHRFDAVDTKFTWLIGIQVAMLATVLGTTLGFYFR